VTKCQHAYNIFFFGEGGGLNRAYLDTLLELLNFEVKQVVVDTLALQCIDPLSQRKRPDEVHTVQVNLGSDHSIKPGQLSHVLAGGSLWKELVRRPNSSWQWDRSTYLMLVLGRIRKDIDVLIHAQGFCRVVGILQKCCAPRLQAPTSVRETL
jgi:hypothetical protein